MYKELIMWSWRLLKIGDFVEWNEHKWKVIEINLKNEMVTIEPTEEDYPIEILSTYRRIISKVFPQDQFKQLSSIKLWRD